jgi:transketolase
MENIMLQNEFNLSPQDIAKKAKSARKNSLIMSCKVGQGHTGADLSEIDIISSMYFRILRQRKDDLANLDRDRFILSKGHGVGGYYCVLAEAGYIDVEDLSDYVGFDTKLPGHPVRQKTPGIELNTGALGHGLPVSVGLALSAKKSGRDFRVYVLTGDGELEEGSNWEAAMCAAHFKLDNLVVINDRNRLQLADKTAKIMGLEPLADKWRAFGFDVHETEGNDVEKFVNTVEKLDFNNAKPHVIIANTTKGKGVSFIENISAWHHKVCDAEELKRAIEELAE